MLNTVLEYHLPIAQAAEIMGVSERHTKRLVAAYRKDGPAALEFVTCVTNSVGSLHGPGRRGLD